MIPFRFFSVFFIATLYVDLYEAGILPRCPTKVCLASKVNYRKEFSERITFIRTPEGKRLHFKPGLFSFGCNVLDMYKACVPGGLDPCIPEKLQKRVKEFVEAFDRIVCTKDYRLDKLIACMNNDKVQKMFFEDLVIDGITLMGKLKRNDSDVCSEMKSDVIATVRNLSAYCDNDGLRALLQLMAELGKELQDVFQMYQDISEYKEICYDEFLEVTSSAQNFLTGGAPVVDSSPVVRSIFGL
ncbi:uncharacterized protein LOC134260731 [Saccostrea cucullata]|uniref:uncharacterized protein LOC134260731 n=1 Tax=Saccostrea cuccullata TaxID=36930 RepID=UPI002ED5707D